jgi:hypothetical protein
VDTVQYSVDLDIVIYNTPDSTLEAHLNSAQVYIARLNVIERYKSPRSLVLRHPPPGKPSDSES